MLEEEEKAEMDRYETRCIVGLSVKKRCQNYHYRCFRFPALRGKGRHTFGGAEFVTTYIVKP